MINKIAPLYKKIYVICAAYYKTGGTEVLHQLVHHINKMGGNAYISYIRLYDVPSLCNPAFEKYVDKSHMIEVGDIEDNSSNAIIIPEGYPEYNDKFSNAVKMLWWLSVDNFEGIYNFEDKRIDEVHRQFNSTIDLHLVQSEYAHLYLKNKGVSERKIIQLGDYINDIYIEDSCNKNDDSDSREDIILFNPRKGERSTRSIMDVAGDLRFVPLENMTSEEVRDIMHRAKIYIDFGNHPGKDRIPREAAMSGLIVITGRHGSADNPVDIQIPDKYKLKEEETSGEDVVDLIKDCIDNYYTRRKDFERYRTAILKEKEEFKDSIRKLFFEFAPNEKDYDMISRNGILIVIVSYNSLHFTQECIKSVRRTMPEGRCKMIIVDNASTDGSVEWLKDQDDILLIRNEENIGFGPACNQAVASTIGSCYESYDVFFLNNDTRLADNALYFLKEALYSDDDIGAVGSVSNYAGNRQQVDISFDRVEDYLEYGRRNNIPMKKSVEERVRLSGFALLIRREAWEKTGGFDEDFAPGYFEDDALSMELLKNGYRLMFVKNSYIYHAGSQSFSKTDYNKLLVDHRELFIKKYGFDIIEYAYSDEAMVTEAITQMAKQDKAHYRVLQIGCGLGADIKMLRGIYHNCDIVGVETNKNLYDILKCTEKVYRSINDIVETYNHTRFDVLLIGDTVRDKMSLEDKKLVKSVCTEDVILITGRDRYLDFPFEKIKLIIWDLDDTLWVGILSEGKVILSDNNVALIKLLTDNGIINSISSKNDHHSVKDTLEEADIWDAFVFNNVNWDEKGTQINDKLNTMGLRAENVLFIDDNARNLEEAKFSNPGLMTATPDIIPYLHTYYSRLTPKDKDHSRLEQYKLLERKTRAKTLANGKSKEQFLMDSDIRITVNRNCMEEIDRIHEMVMRTNQLNYTKNRDDKELLTRQIVNDWNDCAYIIARDKFGDYGIVGFYCYNRREHSMEHFLFSCRVLGMGIEQYIYNMLGCPDFNIKEPVASKLKAGIDIPWIRENKGGAIIEDRIKNSRVCILLKGPCDMSAIEPYLAGANITTEFNYINDKGFVTTGQNHTEHIIESAKLSDEEIDDILSEAPFIIKGDFETNIFSHKYHVICLSLLQDLASGLYRNKRTGNYISFSSKNYDLTDSNNTDRFINKEIQGHDYPFTREIITNFSDRWEFIGNTPLELLLGNLDYIYENVQGKPLFILLLGSEIDCDHNTEEFAGMHEIYREINPVIKAFAEDHERIKVIDPTEFIHSQDDFEDCINHYSRNVYYEIAGRISELINDYI